MFNLLDPAILFFIFGVLAGLVRSNLEIPPQISRFLSLYLLMALGLKGGFALSKSGLTAEVITTLGLAVALAIVIPALSYLVLKRFLGGFDAAAISAMAAAASGICRRSAWPSSGFAVWSSARAATRLWRSVNRERRSGCSCASGGSCNPSA